MLSILAIIATIGYGILLSCAVLIWLKIEHLVFLIYGIQATGSKRYFWHVVYKPRETE
jgi:hypothetical protein